MAPSPRPTFDKPTAIPFELATRHLWGDAESGEVLDWIYVSSSKIHQLVFGLPAGGRFRHSDAHRTIFAADEIYYVLSGTLGLANPETGEVQRVCAGEAAFFRRDTWHHGFNCGTDALRVLEFFAPPPSTGSSSAYARTKPNLATNHYTQDRLLGQWPMERERIAREACFTMVREADVLWRMEGRDNPVMVGLLASTEHLTVGKMQLLPGQVSDLETHGGDESLYVLDGVLTLSIASADSSPWHELKAGDGFYLPQGTAHQYRNLSERPVTILFGVAPQYLAR
jgi:quercetin dioxygenase-like cupin family protein